METTEKKVSHTPGPWTVTRNKSRNKVFISGIDWQSFAKVWVRIDDSPRDNKEALANVKLIAAAPDLLDALKSITLSMKAHPDCEPDSEFADMVSIAERAIKKATV